MLDTVVVRAGGLNDGVEVTAKVYELVGTWSSGTVEPNGTDIYIGNSTGGARMKKRFESKVAVVSRLATITESSSSRI